MKQKPTKVTQEDIELANEIGLVTSIKDAVEVLQGQLESEFYTMENCAETGTPVALYKQLLNSREFLKFAINDLQTRLLVGLGNIEPKDAEELATEQAKPVEETSGIEDASGAIECLHHSFDQIGSFTGVESLDPSEPVIEFSEEN